MSVTIFYKGSLKRPNELSDFFSTAIRIIDKFEWSYDYSDVDATLSVSIPRCEVLLLQPINSEISGFLKCSGYDKETLEQLFEFFHEIKPYFKRLDIEDDFGLWLNNINFSNAQLPIYRELKDIEKAELVRWFDLPKGSTSIFGMNRAQAVLMFMICKDMNYNLSKPIMLEDLLTMVDSRCSSMLKLDANDACFQFIAIAETWFLTKLFDKKGGALKTGKEKSEEHLPFGWLMAEIIFGFSGGSLGSKHQKLHRFINNLLAQDVDFDNPENFLRLIYSVIEYLGGFRPEASITRMSDGKDNSGGAT